MQLSTKHSNEQTVTMNDFTGGLNDSAVPEMIGQNQLARAVNVELDRVTGALKTCCGTAMIFKAPDNLPIRSLMYDRNNNVFLFASGQGIYKSRLIDMSGTVSQDHEKVGTLTGDLFPIYTPWDNGLLIASGGKLQYWDGLKLTKIDDSPNLCNGVFVMDGRVYIWWKDELRLSGVGDMKNWKEDNNDDSASKFIQIGYKDGGEITGVTTLSQDIIIIKNNGRMYRLSGKYPNWSVVEISRSIDCLNRLSFCAVADGVFVLGRDTLRFVQTTTNYGDMLPVNVAQNVAGMFYQISIDESRLIYVPPLNQIWIVGSLKRVIVYDLTYKAFFERQFNSPIIDMCVVKNTVFVARPNKVTRLTEGVFVDEAFSDDESPLSWEFQTRTLVSYNNYLLKRSRVTYVPFLDEFKGDSIVQFGKVMLLLKSAENIGPLIYEDEAIVCEDGSLIFPAGTQFASTRQIYRSPFIDIKASGKGSACMFNRLEFSIAEV